jgi:uncharacterized protein
VVNNIPYWLPVSADVIADFCRRNHIRKLSLFGSVLRDDFNDSNDIDVLVDFKPGHVPGLRFFALQAELSDLLQRPVDLNTFRWLSKYFRDEVMKEQTPIYVEA